MVDDTIHPMNWREHILGCLAAGCDTAAIQREFPNLTSADVAAYLDYARELAEFEATPA